MNGTGVSPPPPSSPQGEPTTPRSVAYKARLSPPTPSFSGDGRRASRRASPCPALSREVGRGALELLLLKRAIILLVIDSMPDGLISIAIGCREGRSSVGRRGAMSRNNGKGPRLELKLDLSLATRGGGTLTRVAAEGDSPNGSLSSSPPSSCLSSCSNSPEAASMVLAGCPRCLMYVMLSEEDPKCPKCKSAVLLDFLHGNTTTTTTTTKNNDNDNNNNNNNNGKSKSRKS